MGFILGRDANNISPLRSLTLIIGACVLMGGFVYFLGGSLPDADPDDAVQNPMAQVQIVNALEQQTSDFNFTNWTCDVVSGANGSVVLKHRIPDDDTFGTTAHYQKLTVIKPADQVKPLITVEYGIEKNVLNNGFYGSQQRHPALSGISVILQPQSIHTEEQLTPQERDFANQGLQAIRATDALQL